MDEPFVLTVVYQGREHDFETRLIVMGYTYKFQMRVQETEVFFERDDAGEFRALLNDANEKKLPDAGLLQEIAKKLEEVLS